MLKFLFALLFMLPILAFAQAWNPIGGKSASMANASVTNVDAWSFHHNPGAAGALTKRSIGLFYENRFLLQELQTQGIVVNQPLKKGVISVGAQVYGFELYRTYRAGIGYALPLSDRFYAGVQLNYLGVQLREPYGTKHGASAEMGLYAKLTDNWTLGVAVFNIGRMKLADFQDDRFTTLMRLGTGYSFSEQVTVVAEAEKNLDYPIRAKIGIDYQPITPFSIRAGVATEPLELTFGFGYNWKWLQIDLGSAFQYQLGWSPHFSITFSDQK
jgi:hypothetical protein